MSEANFIQKVDDIDEIFLAGWGKYVIYAETGRVTKQLFGLKIVCEGKVRKIWLSDLDRIKQIGDHLEEK